MLCADGGRVTPGTLSPTQRQLLTIQDAVLQVPEKDDVQDILQTPSFFQETDRFTALLRDFLLDEPRAWSQVPHLQTLGELTKILDRYQEQPHLIDPHLESIITPVAEALKDDIIRINSSLHELKKYEKSLDAVISAQIGRLHRFLQYLYHVSKVRGYKTTIRFFTHEAADIEPVLEFLAFLDAKGPAIWSSRYMLLLWLSLLVRVPFDLTRIDSATEEGFLVSRMILIGKSFLSASGKERDGAAVFLARLLTRRDTINRHLPEFLEWSVEQIRTEDNIFAITGILSTLCGLYKFGERELLLPSMPLVYGGLCAVEAKSVHSATSTLIRKLMVKLKTRMGLCCLRRRVSTWRYQRGNRFLSDNVNMTSELNSSEFDRRGTVAESATHHEEEDFEVPETIEDVVDRLLNGLRDKDTITRWSAAKGIGRIADRLPKQLAQDVVRCVLDLFVEDSVIDSFTTEVDTSAVSDHAWHGACLALAEVSRRGLVLPELLNEAIPWVIRAAKFDQKRGAHSVGANVRDAACYVCWSLGRAYGADVLQQHAAALSSTLLVVSVFDREVNVRRASSAAFQENVGRTGIFPHGIDVSTTADYFAVGNRTKCYLEIAPLVARYPEYRNAIIDHLTWMSTLHWDKAIRELAALALGRLAPLDLEYLLKEIVPVLLNRTVSPDQGASHGAMMALGEIILGWQTCANSSFDFSTEVSKNPVLQRVADVPADLPPGHLHSFASDIVRQGAAHLITDLARARWPLDLTSNPDNAVLFEKWQSLLESTISERKEEWLQAVAVDGIAALAATYGVTEDTVRRYIVAVEPSGPPSRKRGFALVLGRLAVCCCNSPDLPRDLFPALVRALVEASKTQENRQWNDAEAKRNAILGLTSIVEDMGAELKKFVDYSLFQTLLTCLLGGLEDYSQDQRGDVGSWVREASIIGLEMLVPLVCYLDNEFGGGRAYIGRDQKVAIVGALLRQSVERIDRIRLCAGTALKRLLYGKGTKGGTSSLPTRAVEDIPGRELLEKAIPDDSSINWISPSDVYQRIVRILHVPDYRLSLLTGVVVSAGGLTESLVRHSSGCLVDFIDGLPAAAIHPATEERIRSMTFLEESLSLPVMAQCFLEIFVRHGGDNRIIVPLMEVVGLLLENGVLGKLESTDQFFGQLASYTKKQIFKCRDVRKLMAGLKISCNLATFTDNDRLRKEALQHCFSFLIHPFPKVRRTVAETLYFCFSATQPDDCDPASNQGKLEEVLVSTNWDLPIHELRHIRNSLYPLVGLNAPAPAGG